MTAICFHCDLASSVEDSWRILTGAEHIARWWGDRVTLDARRGGAFVEHWRDGARAVVTCGTVRVCEPPNRLSLAWADDDWDHETAVTFDLSVAGKGARLALCHSGWEPFPAELRKAHEAGWRLHLTNLERYAAGL